MTRAVVVLLGALISASSSLVGQENRWIRIDRTTDLVLYVDTFRKQISNEIADIWTSWEFTTTQTLVDKHFDKMIARFQLDCRQARSKQLEATFYLGKELVVHLDPPVELQQWASATPQSINETLVVRGCLIAKGRPTEPVP